MQHVMNRKLPDPTYSSERSKEPWLQKIDKRYRDRAEFFLRFGPTFAQLGTLPGELRLSIEPLNPLLSSDIAGFVSRRLQSFRVPEPDQDYGLTVISRALVDLYNPTANLFSKSGAEKLDDDLLLYDPLVGFLIWKDETGIRNFWLGNQQDLRTVHTQPEPLRRLLIQSNDDHFSIGKSLFTRLVGPRLKKAPYGGFDHSGIPTITVETQSELEDLADDLKNACETSPNLTVVFRGQTEEHLLCDRQRLAAARVCPYSSVRDHSVIPSMYRHIDRFVDKLTDFRDFAAHLLDWGLYADLVFGDPVLYRTLDGQPYVPKEVPAEALARSELGFSGNSGSRMFKDLGPFSRITITDTRGAVIDQYIKIHRPGFDTVRRNLILQHYGAPTPFVDVTHDIRIAEWFALNRISIGDKGLSTGAKVKAPFVDSIIYAFLVLDGLTPFVNTEQLVTPEQSLRPHRQACALIGGPGNLYRNALSRFIGLKIKFARGFVPRRIPTARHLFPGPDEDNTLKRLLTHYDPPHKTPRFFPVYWFPTKR